MNDLPPISECHGVDVFGNPTCLKPSHFRVSDIKLDHAILGSHCLQVQFVRTDGQTHGYQWPLMSGSTPQEIAIALHRMADGIAKTFKEPA